jgi:hypothetical protein
VEQTQPAWRMMDQFWADVTQPALGLDSLATSHPVSVPVNDPKEIEAIFDTISYKKGSAIIHMLESYMGIEDLRQGLKLYLNKHKFKNAVTKDLWEALALATNHTKDIEVRRMVAKQRISRSSSQNHCQNFYKHFHAVVEEAFNSRGAGTGRTDGTVGTGDLVFILRLEFYGKWTEREASLPPFRESAHLQCAEAGPLPIPRSF